ncbi:hypothetical protein KC878_00430 [Candidatus Saccharibacteria bacterium]|nr:hypothetical protein [Candidatus Saccharibacteria bacterium]MCB9821247.1 hypothetical protein [Candidatus Nomurabacteria bacterium]
MFKKEFFKDKTILLLSLILGLMTLFNILSVLLRTSLSQNTTTLRFWTLQGSPQIEKQAPAQLYSFAIFAVFVAVISFVLSYKLYEIYKPSAYALLLFTMFVILTNTIVSGALLNLQQ